MQRTRLFLLGLSACVALSLSATAASTRDPQADRFESVRRRLADENTDGKRRILLRFINDGSTPLDARLTAAAELRRLDGSPNDHLDAELLNARLLGVGHRESLRARRLDDALTLATIHQPARVDDLRTVLAADVVLIELERDVKRRQGQIGPLPSAVAERAGKVADARAAYRSLGDLPRLARVELALTDLVASTDADVDFVLSEYQDLANVGGDDPDRAEVRAAARRARARLLTQTGRWRTGVLEALRADREGTQKRVDDYIRTEETSLLCARARIHGVDCAELERERLDGPTFYDFRRGPIREHLDSERAERVLAEYGFLVTECVHSAAPDGSRPSEVRLRVLPSGEAQVESVSPKSLAAPLVESCLTGATERMRMPRFRGDSVVLPLRVGVDAEG